MIDVIKIADAADLIVNGYAFTRCCEGYQVLNLNCLDSAAVLTEDGDVLETSMCDIEVQIVKEYFHNNRKFMEGGICQSTMILKLQGIIYILLRHVQLNVCMFHASDRKLTETGSAKFFVEKDGKTVLQKRGILKDREIAVIQEFIKEHYREMFQKWSNYSEHGFFGDL